MFELVSSKADGALVKNIADGNTKYVSSRSHQFSHLESIEIYTNADNANLLDVFLAMKEAGKPLPDSKDNKALKAYFSEVFPDMDFERVYNSDMKKMVRWYEQLQTSGVELKHSEREEESEGQQEEVDDKPEEEQPESAPKKKTSKANNKVEKA